FHLPRAQRDFGRFGHEPFRAPRDALRRAIAPEVIPRLARRQRETVTRRKRALSARATGARQHEYVGHVDERQRRHFGHDVLHQEGQALGVIDHATAVTYSRSSATRTHRLGTIPSSGCTTRSVVAKESEPKA